MQTIAIVDSSGRPRAVEYFGMFRSEPMLPEGLLQIDKVFPIRRMSLFDLLSTISRTGVRNVLTVSHGTGGGLSIPLVPPSPKVRKPTELGATEVELLLKYVAGTIDEDGFGASLEPGARDDAEEVKQGLPTLKALITKVRSLGLEKWVLRACILGSHLDSLENLRKLLGATAACAPKNLDVLGVMRPKPLFGSNAFARFIEEKHPIVDGQAPHRLAWTMSLTYDIGDVVSESQRAPAEFVARHFPKGSYSGNGAFPMHAIAKGENLVFPMDPPYRGLLARVVAKT